GLVGGVVICGPLQGHGHGRAVFKAKNIVTKSAKAAWEIRRTSKLGNEFRGGAAEGAMARKVAGEGWCDKVRSLIRDPSIGMDPFHAAVLVDGIRRWPRPGEHSDLADRQTCVPSGRSGGGRHQFDLIGDEREA